MFLWVPHWEIMVIPFTFDSFTSLLLGKDLRELCDLQHKCTCVVNNVTILDFCASNVTIMFHTFCTRSSCPVHFKRQIRASLWWEADSGIFTSRSTSVCPPGDNKDGPGQRLPANPDHPPLLPTSSFCKSLSPSGRYFVKYLSSVLFLVRKHLIAHLAVLYAESLSF